MAGKMYNLSVTDSNGSQAISPTAHYVKLENSGSNECFIEFNAAATTSKFKMRAGDMVEFGIKNIATVQAICSAAETTTLRINAATEL